MDSLMCFSYVNLTSITGMIYGGRPFGEDHIGQLPWSTGRYGLELA